MAGKRSAGLKSIVTILAVLVAAAMTFFLQVILSRSLLPVDFGRYALINSILMMSAPVASAGVAALLLRRRVRGESGSIGVALAASTILCLLAVVVTIAVAGALGVLGLPSILLSTLCFAMAAQALSVSLAQADEEPGSVALAQIILPLLRILGAVVAVVLGAELLGVSVALAVAGLAAACVYWVLQLRRARVAEPCAPGRTRAFLRESMPYSVNAIVNVAQLQVIVALSSVVFDLQVTGRIAIVMTLLAAVYLLPNTVFGVVLLPRYHRLIPGGDERWLPMLHALMAAIPAILIALFFWWSGSKLMGLAFGHAGAAAYPLLAALVWAIPLRFYSTGIGAALLSESAIRWKVPVSVAAVVVQGALCILLKGKAEHTFATAMIVGELLVAVFYSIVFVREFRK